MDSTLAPERSSTTGLTRKNRIGLGICAVLAVADLAGLAMVGGTDSDAVGPPSAVLVAGAVLGAITLVAVVSTWRTGSRPAPGSWPAPASCRPSALCRPSSSTTSLRAWSRRPASGVAVTLVAVWLVLSPRAR
jgi:hypothetical protein